DDEWPITRWEATALSLASAASIRVPPFRLEMVAKRPVLMLERFDRQGFRRIPFMSAMTALSADDGDSRSYLDIVDSIRSSGSQPNADLEELWRRLVFNVLISNTDDHLRNHGFLHDGVGWRLAPAYDLNPTPVDVGPSVHALALDEGNASPSIEDVLEVSARFGLRLSRARGVARETASVVGTWRSRAAKVGLTRKDIERMATAFEHADRARAAK
ncbi:MAG TPA: HipA domain-containing protein, partial [Polyangiaceae bacterium]